MWGMRDRSVVRSSVTPSAKYCRSGSSLRFVNGRTTIDSRGAAAGGGLESVNDKLRCWRAGYAFRAQRVNPHRSSDVLDALVAQILERIGELVADLLAHGSRDANPAGVSDRLQPSGNIDAVAEDVVFLNDHVAEIDADSKPDALLVGHLRLAVDHPAL